MKMKTGIKIIIGVGTIFVGACTGIVVYGKGMIDGYYSRKLEEAAEKVEPEDEESKEEFLREHLGDFKYRIFQQARKNALECLSTIRDNDK